MACFAGFLTGREAARRMVKRNAGTIIFTGATASVRGAAGFAAFSGAKVSLTLPALVATTPGDVSLRTWLESKPPVLEWDVFESPPVRSFG